MQNVHFWAMLFSVVAFAACSCTAAAPSTPTTRPIVVVELFTSEGCSSCPPADAVLAELAKPDAVDGVEIVPLSMHVDYWNNLGWVDRFSSPAFSKRQQQYARWFRSDQIYTPQMIVDGDAQFVGSDKRAAVAAIAHAARAAKGRVTIKQQRSGGSKGEWTCDVAVDGVQLPPDSRADVLLLVTENDLESAVRHGENAGQTLRHAAVVRSLQRIATIAPTQRLPISTSAKIDQQPGWRADHMNVAVIVQDRTTGKILAATVQPLTPR